MSSGAKELVVNLRERATSGDINRLQKFIRQGNAELLRYLLDVSLGTDDVDAGGLSQEFTSQGNPLRAEVFAGLVVQPQIASTAILVSPGAMCCVDPDATPSADDSAYKTVVDAGVPNSGTLAITANGTINPRIDVIECQRVDGAFDSELRDIYNPSTGLFNATTVTKATVSTLTYRVRAGTPGSGFPGTSQGWLPLAVALMPAGGSTCDDATFWDVRPLLEDRWPSPQSVALKVPRRLKGVLAGMNTDLTTTKGHFDVVNVDGRRLGGRLRRGSPGVDGATAAIDLTDAANRSPDLSSAVNGHVVSLVLLTPFGLPRWARYTDASSGSRVPRSPRGIPVLTSQTIRNDGVPGSAVVFPAAFGFNGASSQAGVAVAEFQWASGNVDPAFGSDQAGYTVQSPRTLTMSGGTPAVTITAGIDFPSTAKAIRVLFKPGFTATSTGYSLVESTISQPGTTTPIHQTFQPVGKITSGDSPTIWFEAWLPIESIEPALATGTTFQLTIAVAGVTGTFSGSTAQILGWRY